MAHNNQFYAKYYFTHGTLSWRKKCSMYMNSLKIPSRNYFFPIFHSFPCKEVTPNLNVYPGCSINNEKNVLYYFHNWTCLENKVVHFFTNR